MLSRKLYKKYGILKIDEAEYDGLIMRYIFTLFAVVIAIQHFSSCTTNHPRGTTATAKLYVETGPHYTGYYDPFYAPYHTPRYYRHNPYITNHSYTHKMYSRNYAHMRSYQDDPTFWRPFNYYLGGHIYLYNGHKYVRTKEVERSPLKGFHGETIQTLPEGAKTITINSKIFYHSRSIIYRKTETESGDKYEAVGMFSD